MLAHQYSIGIDGSQTVFAVAIFLVQVVVDWLKLLLLLLLFGFISAEAEKVRKIAGTFGGPEAHLAGDRLGEVRRSHHVAAQGLICDVQLTIRKGIVVIENGVRIEQKVPC